MKNIDEIFDEFKIIDTRISNDLKVIFMKSKENLKTILN